MPQTFEFSSCGYSCPVTLTPPHIPSIRCGGAAATAQPECVARKSQVPARRRPFATARRFRIPLRTHSLNFKNITIRGHSDTPRRTRSGAMRSSGADSRPGTSKSHPDGHAAAAAAAHARTHVQDGTHVWRRLHTFTHDNPGESIGFISIMRRGVCVFVCV